MTYGFEPGTVYNRRADIHARFGGSQQPGIITTYLDGKNTLPGPIFIVSGASGHSSGYRDDWVGGAFHYFGMGRHGDMTMSLGNKAIRESSQNGRSILLFEEVRNGLRFWGELVYESHYIRRAPDADGLDRDAIVFVLRPVADIADTLADRVPSTDNINELRKRAYEASGVRTPRDGTKPRTIYDRSADVRDYVLARAGEDCEGCEHPAPFRRPDGRPYLEPHHLRRVSDGGPDHPALVIALCPNCHRRVHAGADGKPYNDTLVQRMRRIEPPVWV